MGNQFHSKMKNIIIFFISIFTASNSNSQNYIPFNLDSTSFWINELSTYVYDHVNSTTVYCQAKTMTYVEKDTLINSEKYSILKTFTIDISQNGGYQCNQIYPNGIISLIKEDTINHSIVQLRVNGFGPDSSFIEFDHNVGDTLFNFNNLLQFLVIDSISLENYNGINRRTLHLHNTVSLYNFKIIEGIGATNNFPSIVFQEFGYPGSKLKCYSKKGTILYGDTTVACQKLPPLPVKTVNLEKLHAIKITAFDNMVRVDNNNLIELEIHISNIYGATLFHCKFKGAEKTISLNDFNRGIYYINVTSNEHRETQIISIK